MRKGRKNWIFCDGYLPPHGDNPEFQGHEALMLTNLTNKTAKISLTLVFEDKDPVQVMDLNLSPMRTTCIRMDKPLGQDEFLIGESIQYTACVKSNVDIICCFGRLDVRQANMAYYSVEGYKF